MIQVGQTIYVLRDEHRYYDVLEVVGETSRSWLTLRVGASQWQKESAYREQYCKKLPKSGKGYTLGTKYQHDLQIWASEHRRAISRLVDNLWESNPALLRGIAGMVGFDKMEVNQ